MFERATADGASRLSERLGLLTKIFRCRDTTT